MADPVHSADPAELPPPSKVLLLLAVLMVLTGMAGWTSALLLQKAALVDAPFSVAGAVTLALVVVVLLTGCQIWMRWQRKAIAHRVSAAQLTHVHAVMSQTNRLILRRPNPSELFEGVCEACVNAGHMDLAVVWMSEFGETHRATAAAGVVPLSAQLLLDGARLQAAMARLVLDGDEPVIVDDAQTDARLKDERVASLATRLHSLAAIPLRRGGALVGVLLLCSRTKFSFDGQVTPLLSELGADLSFALDNSDRERERHSALLADRARVTAEDANRAKTNFLARMSHELRTPLNAMLGFAQLLATDRVEVLSKGQAERVRLIAHAGWHLLGLVNDVMDISRIESKRFAVNNVRSDISAVLDEAVALTQPLARMNQVELSERAASKFGIGAVVDPHRLLQVLLNLLSNACKYNRPGGHVRVDVKHRDAEVFLEVVDNGVGMTEEQLSHLFEPFNRLGNEGHAIEGSGIGLTLTRQLVEMMDGRLEIESSPESGTRARLVLPSCAIPLKASVSDAPDSRTERAPQDGSVILYIEDDPINRILVEQMLLRFDGVQLLQAETGAEGIALALVKSPDLVMLDMHLPDMTGFDVLAALRADPRTEPLRVVAVSANAMPADVAKAMDSGMLDYWTKPLDLDAFLAGISKLLSVRVSSHETETSSLARASAR